MVDLDSQPDQAARGRRDRQADADDARLADHVLDRQRRREVLRHHPGGLRRRPIRSSRALNVMRLASPSSAILSAVIFNALIIVFLIPLALKGVQLPAGRRRRAAAPQPADLRPRRPDRALHRHQADRPAARRRSASPEQEHRHEQHSFVPRSCCSSLLTRHHRRRLSARRHRRRAGGRSRRRPAAAWSMRDGKPVGSALIGQTFSDPKYFWGRPSATAPDALQRAALQRLEPGAAEPGADRCGQGPHRGAARRRPGQHARRCRSTWSPRRPAGSIRTSAPAAARYQVGARRAGARPAARGACRR